MRDVADRIKGRVQLTTDRHRAYLNAVEDTFGIDVDDCLSKILPPSTGEDQL